MGRLQPGASGGGGGNRTGAGWRSGCGSSPTRYVRRGGGQDRGWLAPWLWVVSNQVRQEGGGQDRGWLALWLWVVSNQVRQGGGGNRTGAGWPSGCGSPPTRCVRGGGGNRTGAGWRSGCGSSPTRYVRRGGGQDRGWLALWLWVVSNQVRQGGTGPGLAGALTVGRLQPGASEGGTGPGLAGPMAVGRLQPGTSGGGGRTGAGWRSDCGSSPTRCVRRGGGQDRGWLALWLWVVSNQVRQGGTGPELAGPLAVGRLQPGASGGGDRTGAGWRSGCGSSPTRCVRGGGVEPGLAGPLAVGRLQPGASGGGGTGPGLGPRLVMVRGSGVRGWDRTSYWDPMMTVRHERSGSFLLFVNKFSRQMWLRPSLSKPAVRLWSVSAGALTPHIRCVAMSRLP